MSHKPDTPEQRAAAIKKLPLWAQNLIFSLETEIKRLKKGETDG
jgi:hypothetical protein